MQPGADWPTKYPWRLLPRGGTHPYVPPKRKDWVNNPKRGAENGYVDVDDNEWVPAPAPSGRERIFIGTFSTLTAPTPTSEWTARFTTAKTISPEIGKHERNFGMPAR